MYSLEPCEGMRRVEVESETCSGGGAPKAPRSSLRHAWAQTGSSVVVKCKAVQQIKHAAGHSRQAAA